MGVVYLALKGGDRAALKVLPSRYAGDEAFVRRFLRESAALASLDHPGIVSMSDQGAQDGRYYFAMEYVEGASLRALLDRKALGPGEVLALVPPLCEALGYAHSRGVIHRDIKPENLLITPSGQVKIADFGVARWVEGAAPGEPTLTQTRAVMGTRDYMAPEARQSARGADARVDVYSLGVVLYEALTGELPLGHFPPPSEHRPSVDRRLDAVVLKALEKDPARRYQSIRELGRDVSVILASAAAGGILRFSCACGRGFSVAASRAGQDLMCSACGTLLRIPASGTNLPPAAPARPAAVSPVARCPQCGEPQAEGARQCLRCGLPVSRMSEGPPPASDPPSRPPEGFPREPGRALRLLLLSPREAFRRLGGRASVGAALLFYGLSAPGGTALALLWLRLLPLPARPSLRPGLLVLLAAQLLAPFLLSALVHAGLLLAAATSRGFGTTLAVALYVGGAGQLLAGALPCCGAAFAGIWVPLAGLLGILHAHGCGMPKALLAAWLGPLLVALGVAYAMLGLL